MRKCEHNRVGRRGRGFTLIELLVVILVIALVMALLLTAVRVVFRNAQGVADLQAGRSMATGVEQFKNDNGFLVPLVFDGNPLASGDPPAMPSLLDGAISDGVLDAYQGDYGNLPVVQSTLGDQPSSLAVYSVHRDIDFFRGGETFDSNGSPLAEAVNITFSPGSSMASDIRYSKFALSIYLSGVLDREFDGVDGPGLTKPFRDGTFAGVTGEGNRAPIDAYMDSRENFVEIAQGYADEIELEEHQGSGATGLIQGRQFARPFVDRYGRAFRYYRWEPGRSTVVQAELGGTLGANVNAIDLNIPIVLADMLAYGQQSGDISGLPAGVNDREQVDVTGGNAELRSARWAIVGAGPDGLFGTEPMSVLDVAGTAQNEADVARFRTQAQEDNVVILGK